MTRDLHLFAADANNPWGAGWTLDPGKEEAAVSCWLSFLAASLVLLIAISTAYVVSSRRSNGQVLAPAQLIDRSGIGAANGLPPRTADGHNEEERR